MSNARITTKYWVLTLIILNFQIPKRVRFGPYIQYLLFEIREYPYILNFLERSLFSVVNCQIIHTRDNFFIYLEPLMTTPLYFDYIFLVNPFELYPLFCFIKQITCFWTKALIITFISLELCSNKKNPNHDIL